MDRARTIETLEREGLFVTEWTDEPLATYPEHAHAQREVRVVVEGSMTITLGGIAHDLRPGDRLDIAADEPHSATVGSDGVRYLAGALRQRR